MFLLEDRTVVYSATDLASAAACELAVLRALDAKLGRIAPLELPADAMLERAARLGDRHEEQVLASYLARFGPWDPARGTGVATIERPERGLHADRATLLAKHAQTLDVLRTGADVVFQAGFFDGRFGGWADFLVRERGVDRDDDAGPVYAVYDTKLARHAKITALLQVAAYADQLLAEGLRAADEVHLILGDRTVSSHGLADLLPVYRERRHRLERMLDEHQADDGPVAWGDPRYRACGRCDVCVPEVEARRDVLLVAGLRTTQRSRLNSAGIATIDRLAASHGPVEGIASTTLTSLRAQARLQVQQSPPVANGPSTGPAATPVAAPSTTAGTTVVYDLFAPQVIASLPAPDPGDLFFDFEGDPLWMQDGSPDWGLEYLFGVVERPGPRDDGPVFHPFWAHDREQEKQALVDFLDYVARRRERFPDLHIYHYAPYEKSALLRLAGRHGVGEQAVDDLLRAGVLVDLYATVRACLRTGQRSYSLKKLEPLYMDVGRSGEVTTAGDSIVEYATACLLRDSGDLDGWHDRLGRIGEYNEYDCLSTLALRDWLVARAAEHGVSPAGRLPADGAVVAGAAPEPAPGPDRGPGPGPEAPEPPSPEDALAAELVAAAGDPLGRTPDGDGLALLAAALRYHWREEKPFWWAHYDRLTSDPGSWTERRSTFLTDEVSVEKDWHVPPGKRAARRRLRLTGRLEPGSELRSGALVWPVYDEPVPDCAKRSTDGRRGWTENAVVLSVSAEDVDGTARDILVVEETLPGVAVRHQALPMALGPRRPPPTAGITAAIASVARDVALKLPEIPPQPAIDILRRRPPRTLSGRALPTVGDGPQGPARAIVEALLDLDDSYLAVQGPPGTGKTHTGARVIRALVERGWRVGVVAQSHAVVENMLTALVEAGVPPAQIGKKPSTPDAPGGASTSTAAVPWQVISSDARFPAFYSSQASGYVVGGTAWDFTNAKRLPDRPLDLLVIDEAGQFALANTIAVSTAARNLVLLGDPQQLPQVSQGRHPEPVDRSALGWLADGHDTLPAELGYFLAHTWRMHPALCDAVSNLSYEGRLTSMPCTAERSLEGIAPGLRCVMLHHEGNAVASAEEADEVVRQVQDLMGRRWRDPAADVDRPLEPADVLVVAAYNAQVWRVRRALAAAGLADIAVGTVDLFQGRQAPVVIVTTAASSAADVPRGMEFLLNRNRINVAVSRGQWCAVVVRSTGLTDYLPSRPENLAELGAFIGLCARST